MMNIEDVFQSIRLNELGALVDMLGSIDINSVNEKGQCFLHEAAAYRALGCAKELLARNISVNCQDVRGMTPLHYCAANDGYDVAFEIVKAGAELSVSDSYGNEPLWTAVFNARGNYDLVRLLVNNGADPCHKNNNSKSPLDFAAQIGDAVLVSILKDGVPSK